MQTSAGFAFYQQHNHDLPGGSDSKESACNAGDQGSIPTLGDPQRRKKEPSLVFTPGESHVQRQLADYSPWGHKESDMTEKITHTHKSVSI